MTKLLLGKMDEKVKLSCIIALYEWELKGYNILQLKRPKSTYRKENLKPIKIKHLNLTKNIIWLFNIFSYFPTKKSLIKLLGIIFFTKIWMYKLKKIIRK